MSLKVENIEQIVSFKATPKVVYELLMDSKKHASLSGEKAKISRKIGGTFTAWGPHIFGVNLVLIPGKKIVQAWRAQDWWPNHFSIAIFDFKPTKSGTTLKFTQIGVPINQYKGINQGWVDCYWNPMKEALKKN